MRYKVIQNKNYQKLLCANLLNELGDSIDAIAFTWLAYSMTQSASLSAFVFTANILPMVLFQPLVAPLVDKMKKLYIMIMADLLRGICLFVFILLYILGNIQPWMFIVFTFLMNSIEAFRIPAGVSFVSKLLNDDERDEGINLSQLGGRLCDIAGSALGGVLVSISPILAMCIDLLTFILSALLLVFIRFKEVIASCVLQNNYWDNLKGGLQYLRNNRKFMIFLCGAIGFNTLSAVISSLQAAYVSSILHVSVDYLSSASIILTITSLITLYLFPRLNHKILPSRIFSWYAFGSLIIYYFSIALLPYCPSECYMILWMMIHVICGLMSGIFASFVNVMFVKVVEEEYLSRAAGVYNSLGAICTPIISIVIGSVVGYIGIISIMLITGIFAVILFIIFSLSKSCKQLNE